MKKNQNDKWYAALEPQFLSIEHAMPLPRFAALEAVLHLFLLNAPDADPTKAYLLFAQYHLIGTAGCTPMEHILQKARQTLGCYRSQKYWQDALSAYRQSKYDAVRAFVFEERNGALTVSRREENYPYPYPKRQKEWETFWSDQVEEVPAPSYAGKGAYKYFYPNMDNGEMEAVHITFETEQIPINVMQPPMKGKRPPLMVSMQELLTAAEEMAAICPEDPCHQILKTNILKEVSDSTVQTSEKLTIGEVCNIVGMVGSGKTTLIKVLAFWCHQHGYRIAVVVDTVADVLNLQKYLSSFGVSVSPLIGRGERLKYINQVTQPDQGCLTEHYSRYLTPLCLVDGMDAQHKKAIAFGKEPCYAIMNGNQRKLCPYFDVCPGTRMQRDCYTASVVLTTVAGFAVSRVGQIHETFLEVVIRDFDLVIFDESDRVQKTLDQLFMPETSFDKYIRESGGDSKRFMEMGSIHREENPVFYRYAEMQLQSTTVLSCIIRALQHDLGAWRKITYGNPFSALTLLESLYHEETAYQIPKFVYEAIYALIDRYQQSGRQQGILELLLESACKDSDDILFDQLYTMWIAGLGDRFERPEKEKDLRIQDARIKLILKLIYFDHFIRDMSDAYEASHETSYGKNELFGFLQTRFLKQQYFLPSALCGNLFGLKKTETKDIVLFRQFAFGRSLMNDLPYLRTDPQGKPAGPNVILLSGSSWAEGSYEYHINRPVNYILEAAPEKRRFLEKTRFFESGCAVRVSGSGDDQRMIALRNVTEYAVESIIQEYSRNAGKILLIVNSYAQAQQVQHVLEDKLRKSKCNARVCRMISDAVSDQNKSGTVRRGEVSRFAYMDEDILIAPAMAIERGHNIVDESGHSALASVFFLVRPMSVPDDIQQKGSKLNGYVESKCRRAPNESVFSYNARVRQFASRQWAQISGMKSFGLAELDADSKKDVVSTLFILILQIFGRLARVTDVTKPEPHVYFVDGAFRGRNEKQGDFDCLSELGRYLDRLMTRSDSAAIAKTLYEPFYQAYRRDIPYEQ